MFSALFSVISSVYLASNILNPINFISGVGFINNIKEPSAYSYTLTTPVYNQGSWGTCVTFATATLIDNLVFNREYTSKLCLLQLSKTLSDYTMYTSAWDGSYGFQVLGRVREWGVMDIALERRCGASSYNAYSIEDRGVNLDTYNRFSMPIYPLDIEQFEFNGEAFNFDDVKTKIVKTLRSGNLVMAGFYVLDLAHGINGANSKFIVNNDSWTLSKDKMAAIIDNKEYGLHEVVIYGYDDNAIITDPDGIKHKGVFKIRNSWGTAVGNKGDFYMSYDYFNAALFEAYAVTYRGDPR